MANDDDFKPGLKTELEAALAVLETQIRGLDDRQKVSLSKDTLAAIKTLDDMRHIRLGFLTQAISAIGSLRRALDNLFADGYPALPKLEVSADVLKDLQEQRADEALADAQFTQAVSAAIVFGPATIEDKPTA